MKPSIVAATMPGVLAQAAVAQTYPDRPVRIVVSFPPGGSTDFSARILSEHLPRALGQTSVVRDETAMWAKVIKSAGVKVE